MKPIREYLKETKLITDGSFGTYFAEKYQTEEIPETANTACATRVAEIHKEYIAAGAKLIRTNTFASNAVSLGVSMEAVKENICAAVRIAKEVVAESGQEIYIAGDIGPIPADEELDEAKTEDAYFKLAKVFVEQGIDILTFETFSDMDRILPAIKRIKNEYDVFVMVQFAMNQFGYSNSGLSAKKLLMDASRCKEIDAIGFNCGVGPGHMEQIIKRAYVSTEKFLIALPNAGYPKRIRNRIRFDNTPGYFAQKVKDIAAGGADIIGGCCGTRPIYIEKLAKEVDVSQQKKVRKETEANSADKKKEYHGFFAHEDGTPKKKKLIAVELAPPADADDEKLLEAAHILQKANVDVLTFPDSPSGRTRIDSVLMAEKVRQETGLTVMPHICCRDKNAIAMRSLFLGAHINEIYNMLIITGDPVPTMIRPNVKSVFNFDSVGLMKIAQDMNEEVFKDRPISYGGAINQGRRNLDVEIGRVKKKMAAGAEFFLTQPVFCTEDADRIRQIKEETGARILCGIMPLISRKNALFMKNEVAGVPVTDAVVERYPENGTKEEGEAVGIAIAKEMMEYTKDFVDGYYFSFPFNRVHMLQKILADTETVV